MNKTIKLTFIFMILSAFFVSGCARMPTAKKSTSLIQKHFKKYGKKYPGTIYGKSKLKEVDINSQSEIHKHLIEVEAFITLEDGSVQRIHVTIVKAPLGWKFLSWENDTGS